MNPYLTPQGRWVLLSGAIFLVGGVFLSDPLMLLIGQVHIVLLLVGVMLLVPGALALDRRLVSLQVISDAGMIAKDSPGTGRVVGEPSVLSLSVRNRASVPLHHLRARPFMGDGLKVSEVSARDVLPPNRVLETEIQVEGTRAGRWVLHGFDMTVSDPLGLVDGRDYLPCTHAFEVYPFAGAIRRQRRTKRGLSSRDTIGAQLIDRVGSGTDLRELRDYQAGDAMRDIAWKTSMRTRKLVSRDYEHEVTTNTYFLLDVSSSMRGGQWSGQKLDFGVQQVVDQADAIIRRRDRVGLVTFDERVYGHIGLGQSGQHMRRILHHLVGLNAVVDSDLTELDETDVERLAADYLLVQERLDFRKGDVDSDSGVNRRLMSRWLTTLSTQSDLVTSPVLREGVVSQDVSPLRRFLQTRGVEVPFRVEARLGMKERGLVQALETVTKQVGSPTRIVVVTDLCGVLNPEVMMRTLRQMIARKHVVEFQVLFTPSFYRDSDESKTYQVVRDLFTSAESDERSRVVSRLRQAGVLVRVVRPNSEAIALSVAED